MSLSAPRLPPRTTHTLALVAVRLFSSSQPAPVSAQLVTLSTPQSATRQRRTPSDWNWLLPRDHLAEQTEGRPQHSSCRTVATSPRQYPTSSIDPPARMINLMPQSKHAQRLRVQLWAWSGVRRAICTLGGAERPSVATSLFVRRMRRRQNHSRKQPQRRKPRTNNRTETTERTRARPTEHNRCCDSRRSGHILRAKLAVAHHAPVLAGTPSSCCTTVMLALRRYDAQGSTPPIPRRPKRLLDAPTSTAHAAYETEGTALCHLAARGWPTFQSTFADTKLTPQLRVSGTYAALPAFSLEPPLSPLHAALTIEVICPPRSQLLFFGAGDPSSKLRLQSTYHAATGRLGTTPLSNGRPHVAVCADVTTSQYGHFSDGSSPALFHVADGACISPAPDAFDAATGDTPMADVSRPGLGADSEPSHRAVRRTSTTRLLQHRHVSPPQHS